MERDLGKLLLRIGSGALLITHGYPKFLRLISGEEINFADPFGLGEITTFVFAIIAELLCPILIILGWKTRWACILPIVTMATAALVIHINDEWGRMELPLLYLTAFLAVAFMDAGKYSIDKK